GYDAKYSIHGILRAYPWQIPANAVGWNSTGVGALRFNLHVHNKRFRFIILSSVSEQILSILMDSIWRWG
ncbi:MAG: hypothetical protein DRO89_03030, partial [Candidatus Altiarchaeales archaeon]